VDQRLVRLGLFGSQAPQLSEKPWSDTDGNQLLGVASRLSGICLTLFTLCLARADDADRFFVIFQPPKLLLGKKIPFQIYTRLLTVPIVNSS